MTASAASAQLLSKVLLLGEIVVFALGSWVAIVGAGWYLSRQHSRALHGISDARDRQIWAARRSSAFVGVASRRELVHLPQPLEHLVVEAQRIRRRLQPLDELRPDARRALWEWLADLARLERHDGGCLERLGIRHAAIASRLEEVWGAPPRRRVKVDRIVMRGWLHQLIVVDQELWAFIHAARGPSWHGYR